MLIEIYIFDSKKTKTVTTKKGTAGILVSYHLLSCATNKSIFSHSNFSLKNVQ